MILPLISNEYIVSFLLGGRCYCEIENVDTGNNFEYRIERNKQIKNMYFVHDISNKESEYLGYFYDNEGHYVYHKGTAGKALESDIRIKALMYVLRNWRDLPDSVIVKHKNRCSICGNELRELSELRSGLCNLCRK